MLKLYIFGYLNGVHSSRRLARECLRNLEAIWLVEGLAPGYRTIAEFRKLNGKAFKGACKDFVALCKELDLLGGESVQSMSTSVLAAKCWARRARRRPSAASCAPATPVQPRPAKAARSRGSACANLAEARTQLVAMIGESDPAKLDDYNAKVQAASSALDADLASMAGGPDAAKADAFKPVWEAFKETREADIIPAVYGGEPEKAKAVATGVQAGRMKEMKAAMGCE